MANRFGENSAVYDLSRVMTFSNGLTQFELLAPIILDNPPLTSGIALFSHTPQPFTVAVAAASELSLIDLDFANTSGAGTQFYGIKIETNTDVVDTGAGIAIFNSGRSDAIYLNVAGKSGNAASNTPTGVGIDINKEIASSAERASANSSQQGIQIFDWSTTDQGVGGPRGILINKVQNNNTDHLLMTLRSNRNMLQFVVTSNDGIYDGTKPAIRFDDEDTGITWWQILARGEQVFNKNGIGIQWITPGGKTAYILASTNDLKLKSGGTGIRFVNQADTQTIVMMQDDLTVDIPNGEVRFKALKIVEDRLENWATNALGYVSINYNGYNGGTTQFRDTQIFDGKQNVVAIFQGSTRHALINLPGGSMYADDIAQAVTISVANTEAKVPGSLTGGLCNGFTFQNSRELLCSVAGVYNVSWGMSISSGTNNQNLSGGVVINTVTWQHNTEGSSNQNNSNNPVHVGGAGRIALAVNDTVGLYVENESAGNNITVRHANLVVTRVGA